MDVTDYVDALRRDLAQAARAMGPESEEVAERLGFAIDSSARLALLDALSEAAAEITTGLEGRSVEVRLHGREPVFVIVGEGLPVTRGEAAGFAVDPDAGRAPADEEGIETARLTLRLPEALKTRAEELAASRGQSLNTWLVNAVRSAASDGPGTDWGRPGRGAPGRNRSSNKRVQGWVR